MNSTLYNIQKEAGVQAGGRLARMALESLQVTWT